MIKIIVAVQAMDDGIGLNEKLLFRIPKDLERFVAESMGDGPIGHPVIMGHKTWDGIPEKWRPLKGRQNFILSKDPELQGKVPPGVMVFNSPITALDYALSIDSTVCIGGGGEVNRAYLRLGVVDEIVLTVVEGDVPANIYFKEWKSFGEEIVELEDIDPKSGLRYRFSRIKKRA